MLFNETPATSGIWSSVLWQSLTFRRASPLEGLTGQVKDSLLCLYLSMAKHTDTRVQLCQRWAIGHVEWPSEAEAAARSAKVLFPFYADTLVTGRLAAYQSKQFIRVINNGGLVIQAEGKCMVRWGVQANVISPLNQPAICWVMLTPPSPPFVCYDAPSCQSFSLLINCVNQSGCNYCVINSRWNDFTAALGTVMPLLTH